MLLFDIFLALYAPTKLSESLRTQTVNRTDLEFAIRKKTNIYRSLNNTAQNKDFDQFISICQRIISTDKTVVDLMFNVLLADDTYLPVETIYTKLTEIFYLQLREQAATLNIAKFGLVFIDHPVAFASFIRSLLWHGVKPMEILSTHLLQDYLRYYLYSLHSPNNSVSALYHLFDRFTETQSLCVLAKKIRCTEEGLSSYALDGSTLSSSSPLVRISPRELPAQFTLNTVNLKNLFLLFGDAFLVSSLSLWQAYKTNAIYADFLMDLFNQNEILHKNLPTVLSLIQDKPEAQSALAALLTPAALDNLLERRIVSVFCLIPYCPHLSTALQQQDLELYLQNIHRHITGLPLIGGLFALFESVVRHNEVAAKPLLHILIDAILEDPYAIDDTTIYRSLRKHALTQRCIIEKVHQMETIVGEIIQKQTEDTFENMDYIAIEDVWRPAALKIKHLQEIVDFKSQLPSDKHELMGCIAKSFFAQKKMPFVLSAFVLALNLEHPSHYERLLIELLGSIDDELLRTECLNLLDIHANSGWRTFPYGGVTLLERAISSGNLGLVQLFDKTKSIKPKSIDALAIHSAQQNHWPVVYYFHQTYKLKRTTVNVLLHLAITHDAAEAIPMLWLPKRTPPSQKMLEQAFKISVQKDSIPCTRSLLNCSPPPSTTVMANGFNHAMLQQSFDLAVMIAEAMPEKCQNNAIELAILDAARTNKVTVLVALEKFSKPPLTENALRHATRAAHIEAAQCLLHYTSAPPRATVIKTIYKEAKKQKKMPILAVFPDDCGVENPERVFNKRKSLKKIPSRTSNDAGMFNFPASPKKNPTSPLPQEPSKKPAMPHALSCSALNSASSPRFFKTASSNKLSAMNTHIACQPWARQKCSGVD